MKIQFASDLHLEFGSKKVKFEVLPDVDVLVFAGDIHTNPGSIKKFFRRIRQAGYEGDIVYVLGNHEFYGHDFFQIRKEYIATCTGLPRVYLLEKDTVHLEGVRFVGTCLYSDLSAPLAGINARNGITDFDTVRMNDDYDNITPEFWTEEHNQCKSFLSRELTNGDPMNTVVVTHFVPSYSLAREAFRGDVLQPAFHVEMSELMLDYEPAFWIYGHNHDEYRDTVIGRTRVMCNQMGYYYEDLGYIPRIIEV